jgi:Phage tail sheath protein subtilisin-like domain
MANQVFVSPGVYTSEKDLTYVTRQVGVTTLGLAGETTKGPAFQPIFVSNYTDFMTFFGGLDNTLVNGPDGNGAPLYELPYIAKSYLSQSNQLFVTRVLGLSGYDAGQAWGITLLGVVDTTTTATTASNLSFNPFISFTASNNVVTAISSSDSIFNTFFSENLVSFNFLATMALSGTNSIAPTFTRSGSKYTGASATLMLTKSGSSGGYITGSTTGVTTHYSGSPMSSVEGKIVATLRSRGYVDYGTQLPVFQVSASTGLIFDPASTAAATNPLGVFSLSGYSATLGAFDYTCSFDETQKNYISKVLGRGAQDGKTAIYVDDLYMNMFNEYNSSGDIYGINLTLVNYNNSFSNYFQQYQPAVTPYVVSELRGNKVLRLFRFWTISDGASANNEIKISILNIDPDTRVFDLYIRDYYDTDASPVILEAYSKLTMDPNSNNFIAKKIGTYDGVYASKSSYVLLELDTDVDTSTAFPAGFLGYPQVDFTSNSNSSVVAPTVAYNTAYSPYTNVRKYYLGISDTIGIDDSFFTYKGMQLNNNIWTGLTHGFHMDVNATGATIDDVQIVINSSGGTYSPVFLFDTGVWQFRTDAGLVGGPYASVAARKFTFVPYGGFDGWDIYRTRRTNLDAYAINQSAGQAGLNNGRTFKNYILSNGELGINSDYYAYLQAIYTFSNPEAVNINVFSTPGIDTRDNGSLVNATIEMVEINRADSLYVVTTPDTSYGTTMTPQEAVSIIEGSFDSNYTATYWPWVQILDSENNVYIYVPPTRDVVRNIALTDNIAFPWFAVAGIQRGDVDAIKARTKLTLADRDMLYENRINPIATFTSDGIKIWGNKTLQVADTYLNRINVRRLLLQARKLISAVAIRLLFEQNDNVVRNQFLSLVNPILDNIRTERGLSDFRVVLSNSPEDIDNNQLTGQIYLKPTTALEFIVIQFNIMNAGASFQNI